jgi:hypothetical protein
MGSSGTSTRTLRHFLDLAVVLSGLSGATLVHDVGFLNLDAHAHGPGALGQLAGSRRTDHARPYPGKAAGDLGHPPAAPTA